MAIWLSCRRIDSRFARTSPGVPDTSSPPTVTTPELIGVSRATIDRKVDLPAPLGPMMAVTPPAGIRSDTPSTTSTSP